MKSIAIACNYIGYNREVSVSDCPTKSYKWGVIDLDNAGKTTGALWFKTRKDAQGFVNVNRRNSPHAVAHYVHA